MGLTNIRSVAGIILSKVLSAQIFTQFILIGVVGLLVTYNKQLANKEKIEWLRGNLYKTRS